MKKEKPTFESVSIDHPLIEWIDVQVPYDAPSEGDPKAHPPGKNGKTSSINSKKKKPGKRGKN